MFLEFNFSGGYFMKKGKNPNFLQTHISCIVDPQKVSILGEK